MKKTNELSYKELKMVCNPDRFEFASTADLDPIDTGIGQDRGIKALEFGLNVDVRGYNLYVEGPSGVGKTMYTRNYLDIISKKKKAPQDWCYIYNFDNPNEPVAVALPAGGGKEFCNLMDHFIDDVKIDIKSTFNNEEFEKERALIKQEFEDKRNLLMEKLNQKSSEYGFQVKASQTGIYMMPIMNGKAIAEEEFNKLDENIRKEYEDKSGIVQQHIMEAIGEIKSIERESAQKIEEWQSNVALLTVNTHINYIKSKYKRNKKINHFLDSIKKDILKNISHFIADDKNDKQQAQPAQNVKPELVKPWLNYRVNLFIDNSKLEGAPVIMDSNYSYHNIFGKLEYENYYGALKTDYTMLKPGLLHEANGGYIIFQANDLLSNSLCYESLKKALRTKELGIENAADPRSSMVMISLKPEPIPLNLKVIIIGEENIYQTLLQMDNDFRKLFKIKVEFEADAPITMENMNKLARFMAGYCRQEELPPLTKEAVAKMIEYASKIAENQEKLSTRFSDLAQIIGEAATWARMSRSKTVNEEHVDKALKESVERVKKYDSRYMEMIEENTLLI
ncbi:MAG: AAA family ATPase, partial [Clostridia bacterium]|nr:AAA family ATPase [Clostridia bacterium]